MKVYCPCQGCKERCFCCHASCSKYAAYKAELSDLKEQEKRAEDFNSFLFATKKQLMKKGAKRLYYKGKVR